MRSEFYLEDPSQSPDQFEFEERNSIWNSKVSIIVISLAIITGGFAAAYLISKHAPTESVKPTQKLADPLAESTPESMTESTTWEASEPIVVESYKEMEELPELIVETPPIDSNESKNPTDTTQSQQPKPTSEKATIIPEKPKQTPKKTTTQEPKKPARFPSKGLNQRNSNLEQPSMSQPEPKKIDKKLLTTPKEEPSQSIRDIKDWSIQWIVPNKPTKEQINKQKKPFQLEPYLLTKEGTLISLITQKNLDLDNRLHPDNLEQESSTLIPLIQIELPTNLETFASQIHHVKKLINKSPASEIHINLIEENSPQTNKDIYILLTSLIHQMTEGLEKKLILQRSSTQPDLALSLLQVVDGIQISTPPILKKPISSKLDPNKPLIPTINKIQSWNVKQELIISRDQIPSITTLEQSQIKFTNSGDLPNE